MSWIQVEKKHQKKYNRDYVLCEDQSERKFIVDSIIEEFSWLSREKVEQEVMLCCRMIPSPRKREMFIGVVAALIEQSTA